MGHITGCLPIPGTKGSRGRCKKERHFLQKTQGVPPNRAAERGEREDGEGRTVVEDLYGRMGVLLRGQGSGVEKITRAALLHNTLDGFSDKLSS